MGTEGRRTLRLRHKANPQLFELYDSQLVLKHQSREALEESRRVLGHFKAFLGEYPPSPELAVAYLAQFRNRKPATLYRYTAILKSFLGWYGEELKAKIQVPQTMPDYVENEHIDRVREAIADKRTHKRKVERNLVLIEVAIFTGLRRAELAHLEVSDINLDRAILKVRLGKNQKDRWIDLTPSLVDTLRIFLKGKTSKDSVFGLQPCTISDIIRRAARKADVPIHTHSLRDYFGQRLLDEQVDIETIRKLLGHSGLSVTRRYVSRTDAQRREAINRLDKPREAMQPTDGRHLMAWELPKYQSKADQQKQG